MVETDPFLGAFDSENARVVGHPSGAVSGDQDSMTQFDTADLESDGTDLDDRDVRALTEFLTVVPEAPGLYTVTSQSGAEYTVDIESGACTCPDAQYNLDPGESCKHARRCAFETGETPLPAWIDTEALPSDFAAHVDAGPVLAAADGGSGVIATDDDAETSTGTDRPEDCQCWDAEQELPCWPCYRDGFRSPNPEE
jgi:hypothetical protein